MSFRVVEKNTSLLKLIGEKSILLKFEFPVPDLASLLQKKTFKFEIKSPFVNNTQEPTLPPALKNLSNQILDNLQSSHNQRCFADWAKDWANKLLRVCEVRRYEIQKILGHGKEDVHIIVLRLCAFFLHSFYLYNDARFVNIALKILDLKWLNLNRVYSENQINFHDAETGLVIILLAMLSDIYEIISDHKWKPITNLPLESRLIKDLELPKQSRFPPSWEVVIFSPNPRGFATLCVAELLKRYGICIRGIVVRRVFQTKRILDEVRRDGLKWVLRKILYKYLFRKLLYHKEKFQTLVDFTKELGLEKMTISFWCKKNGADYLLCNTLNDANVHSYLKKVSPKLVVFTGGGIINEETIALSGDGVLNCHGGLLPPYRGLDLYEWPALEKNFDHIGLTTHFMSKYVDEGDIFYLHQLDVKPYNSFKTLIKLGEVPSVKLLVYTTVKYLSGEVEPIKQTKESGRQYFYMHPDLVEIALRNYMKFSEGFLTNKP